MEKKTEQQSPEAKVKDDHSLLEEILEATKAKQAAGTPVRLSFETVPGFEGIQRLATAMAKSTIVPEKFRGIPGSEGWANTMVALEIAVRLNFPPLLVMQNLTLIEGKPSWQGKFYVALLNASTKWKELDWEWKGEPGSDKRGARVFATRVSDGKRCYGQWVDIAMAKAEGWYSRSRSKWVSMPEQMLVYRSASYWANQWYPECTLGLPSTEEAIDVQAVEQTMVAPPDPKQAKQKPVEAPASEQPAASSDDKKREVDEKPMPGPESEPSPFLDTSLEPGTDPTSMIAGQPDPLAEVAKLLDQGDRRGALKMVNGLAGELQTQGMALLSDHRKANK